MEQLQPYSPYAVSIPHSQRFPYRYPDRQLCGENTAMKLQQILDRIDQAMAAARADGRDVTDRSVSIAASGSGDLIRNWRRSSKSGRVATATLDKITKVAAALHVSADWLMTGEGDPGEQPPVSALDAGIMAQLDQLTDQEKGLLLAAAQGMIAARGRDS